MRLALYQPDIAPNVGTMLRLGACLGIPVDIIEPCGFPFGARDLKRAVMDYAAAADVTRHISWQEYSTNRSSGRLILLTTRAEATYTDFMFEDSDILLLGRESAGVPENVHQAADHRLCIPMAPNMRSINVALSAAMVLGEALRQTGHFSTFLPSVETTEQL
ncbi:tRNA (cytidine(34)-2'-O)-methyltransferase [uncultured Sneathiella sp.]|jgi:tRNA (cytidine/uridine-2'-O-)-methyltransferase|uniref:tRNA (cytidine(34)-2'-O)-methyltransferase n=1 Tax=uncultured Sneathiella sp. TaxID=879315 RepID=UPI0030DDD5D9|tara:strand:+ start:8916 stop:9401 length:486 start_codon:yes stop_codon:yes gene_type:complete